MSYMHNIDPHYIIYSIAKKFKALRIMEDALKSYIESTTKKNKHMLANALLDCSEQIIDHHQMVSKHMQA